MPARKNRTESETSPAAPTKEGAAKPRRKRRASQSPIEVGASALTPQTPEIAAASPATRDALSPATELSHPGSSTSSTAMPATDPPRSPYVAPPPLIKTAYNQAWLRAIFLVSAAILLGAGVFGGWWWYQRYVQSTSDSQSEPVSQLQVASEDLDEERASEIARQVQPTVPPDTGSHPDLEPLYVAAYDAYTTEQLYTMLAERIAELAGEGVDVRTLQSYEPRAQQLAGSDPGKERQLLMEALQLAREFQALHEYYRE